MDDLISRQAAIDALRNYLVGKNVPCDGTLTCQLIENEVINKLPFAELGTNLAEVDTDVPDINVGELISREQAIDAAIEAADDWDGGCNIGRQKRIEKYIRQLPPAEPKKGRWHYSDGKPARIGLSFGVICDQCGTESEYCTNFCGECGADMRGEQYG